MQMVTYTFLLIQIMSNYLHNNHKKFENEMHLKNWLIRVVINNSLNILKSKKRTVVIMNTYISNAVDEKELEDEEEIRECISLLNDNYKTVIILYYYNKYNIDQISDILKISKSNVTTRLNRARNKLKSIIMERRKNNEAKQNSR